MESLYFQYFCGEEFFQHRLPFDRSSITRWRQRMGGERLKALLAESLMTAIATKAMAPVDLSQVVVDATVMPKNVMFPTDAKLANRAREYLVRVAKANGLDLRQAYTMLGKLMLIKHKRYAHAKQFKRAGKTLKKLRTYLGRTFCDITRQIKGNEVRRILADAGYHGHNAPETDTFRVFTSGQKRGVTDAIKKMMYRRSAIEPVIGHIKNEHRMNRNYLAHRSGDSANAILAAMSYNFRLILNWLKLLLCLILEALSAQSIQPNRLSSV